jgi:hypothetical protein
VRGDLPQLTREIPLTQGKVALVDDADYEWLSQWKWYFSGGYAIRQVRKPTGKYGMLGVHRALMQPPSGMEVDHIDGDGLNNQRINLRVCTHRQNMYNIRRRRSGPENSQYIGVNRSKHGHWEVSVSGLGFLGTFSDEVAAANAYNHYTSTLRGEFAVLNDVPHMPDWASYRFQGSSRYRGVIWDATKGKWRAAVHQGRKTVFTKRFTSEIEAAKAYNEAALRVFGDKARLNNLDVPGISEVKH